MLKDWVERIRCRREYREMVWNALEQRCPDSDKDMFNRLRRSRIGRRFFVDRIIDGFDVEEDGDFLKWFFEYLKTIDWDKVMEIIMFVLENIVPLFMKRKEA